MGGFVAGVFWGLVVSAAALVALSLSLGGLPGEEPPGAAQVTVAPLTGSAPDAEPDLGDPATAAGEPEAPGAARADPAGAGGPPLRDGARGRGRRRD